MINSVLNHLSVPREIIRSILIHEFLHIEIRPREMDGKCVSHPLESCQRENEPNTQLRRLWAWLNFSFLGDMIVD